MSTHADVVSSLGFFLWGGIHVWQYNKWLHYTNSSLTFRFQRYVSSYFFPILMTLAWLAVMGTAIRNLVYDREKRIDDAMHAMGMRPGVSWLAWFINTYLEMLILSLVVTMFLKLGNLMRYSNPVVIIVFLADYSLAMTMLW